MSVPRLLARIPLHFILFAVIPPLSLFTYNLGEVNISAIWRVLVFSLLLCSVIFLVFLILFRSTVKASIGTFAALFAFSIFVPAHQILVQISDNQSLSRTLLTIGVGQLLVSVIWLLKRDKISLPKTTQILNVFSLALLLVLGIQSLNHIITAGQTVFLSGRDAPTPDSGSVPAGVSTPDVYFIVLDSYGRSDQIKNEIGYDNSEFLGALEGMGFYIADCSLANYSKTEFSISSTLNMDYMHEQVDERADQSAQLRDMLQKSIVIQSFQDLGYQFVSFESQYPFLNFDAADVLYSTTHDNDLYSLSDFERLYLEQTPLRVFVDNPYLLPILLSFAGSENKSIRLYGADYDSDKQIIENLERSAREVASPKFVYAHIIAPHPPFVFSPDGSYTDNGYRLNMDIMGDFYIRGYSNEMRYLDHILPDLIRQIRHSSDVEPIIILQGDHGFNTEAIDERSNLDSRLAILNAIYLPGMEGDKGVYASMSPVNTFRIILNGYFGWDLELLPDRAYFVQGNELTPYNSAEACGE